MTNLDLTPKRPNPTVSEDGDVWGLVILIAYVVLAVGAGVAYLLGVR